jgi:hypothetical protein
LPPTAAYKEARMRRLFGGAYPTGETVTRKWMLDASDTLTARATVYAEIATGSIQGLPPELVSAAALNIAKAMEKYAELDRVALRALQSQEAGNEG